MSRQRLDLAANSRILSPVHVKEHSAYGWHSNGEKETPPGGVEAPEERHVYRKRPPNILPAPSGAARLRFNAWLRYSPAVQIHAAPTELVSTADGFCYKHAAPYGAGFGPSRFLLNSDDDPGEHQLDLGPLNLCSSVFICGSFPVSAFPFSMSHARMDFACECRLYCQSITHSESC